MWRERCREQIPDPYHVENDERFPAIGSRVRRGPDWSNDDQDGNGPGTIVGHMKDCMFIVYSVLVATSPTDTCSVITTNINKFKL